MIWIAFQILLYVIFAFDRFDASGLVIAGNSDPNYHPVLQIINTIEPIGNVNDLSINSILSAIRKKIREAFASQHPNSKFNLRAYDIENWPPSVKAYGSNYWHKSDILLINERIPYLRFVPKEPIFKARNSISDTFKKDYHKMVTKEKIFERFKLETCQPSAKKIDWRLLDRRQIPKKYEKVKLCSTALKNSLIYKNPEIVDNIHFYPAMNQKDHDHTYLSNEDDTDDSESEEKDNANTHDHVFSPAFKGQDSAFPQGLQVISREDNSISGTEDEFDIEGLLDLFDKYQEDEGQETENHKYITTAKDAIEIQALKSQPNCEESINLERVHEKRRMLKMDLKKLFRSQNPNERLVYRNYEILNWPEGVGNIWDCWSKSGIEKIRENMHKYVFKKRPKPFSMTMEFGLEKLGAMDDILDESMTYESTVKILLARYREETGESNACRIRWNRVDRRDIPAKYDGIEFNTMAMKLKKFYKNPDIVNNIHFYKPIDYVRLQRKRKFESDLISDDVTV